MRWSVTSWPEREPIAFDITITALDGSLEHEIRIVTRERLELVWFGIYFEGLLSPESGAGLYRAVYLSSERWLWRGLNNPPPELAHLELIEDGLRLGMTAPIERPDAASDVLELTAAGDRCHPVFPSDPSRYIEFRCPEVLTLPIHVELVIRPASLPPLEQRSNRGRYRCSSSTRRTCFPCTDLLPFPLSSVSTGSPISRTTAERLDGVARARHANTSREPRTGCRFVAQTNPSSFAAGPAWQRWRRAKPIGRRMRLGARDGLGACDR